MVKKLFFTLSINKLYICIYIVERGNRSELSGILAGGHSNLMSQAMPNLNALKVYQPRNPRAGGYYQCVEDHFEELEQIWDDQYASQFGFRRDHITKVKN